MTEYTNKCSILRAICERARMVRSIFSGPLEDGFAEVEVMSGSDGTMSLHVQRSHKKWDGKKYHTQSLYVTLSRAAWAHLISAPMPPCDDCGWEHSLSSGHGPRP